MKVSLRLICNLKILVYIIKINLLILIKKGVRLQENQNFVVYEKNSLKIFKNL